MTVEPAAGRGDVEPAGRDDAEPAGGDEADPAGRDDAEPAGRGDTEPAGRDDGGGRAAGPDDGGVRAAGPGERGAAEDAGAVVRRRVARVVLLDPEDRVLLVHGVDPADPTNRSIFTPGGGVDPGETLEGAALRELAEETGITSVRLGPVIWRRASAFDFDGRRWEQDEWYFLGHTTATRVDTSGHTELERRSVLGLRWWTCRELLAARETVFPTGLAVLLRRLLDEGPPRPPLVLTTEIR